VTTGESVAPGTVEVAGLSYWYPPAQAGDEPILALDDVTFRVEPGAILGIMGPSGSGKSTLCLALNGIVPRRTGGTFRGTVTIGGWETRRVEIATMVTRVAMVFQQPESNFVGLSVADEVAFGPENLGVAPAEIAERVAWALDTVGMTPYRDSTPARLSGGQKQRVAIAAALAMRPAVLVLDEPTAALDPVGAGDVLAVLTDLAAARRTTIILVSHDAGALAAYADRILVLDRGRIIADDPPARLFAGAALAGLRERGVEVPVIANLASDLNEELGMAFAFLTVEQAHRDLVAALHRR
jgi:energy-coupling factor transport system ATP-binding protein